MDIRIVLTIEGVHQSVGGIQDRIVVLVEGLIECGIGKRVSIQLVAQIAAGHGLFADRVNLAATERVAVYIGYVFTTSHINIVTTVSLYLSNGPAVHQA